MGSNNRNQYAILGATVYGRLKTSNGWGNWVKLISQNDALVVYEDITQTIDAFSAGNPGSRAAQYIISDIGKTGYSIINAVMKSHPDSAAMNCTSFLAGNNESGLYLNVYRASGSAYSGGGTAKIRVTYLRN